MHDPIAVGRRSALRAVAVQGLVAMLTALACLAFGGRQALAAGIGGLALVLGNALNASLALGGIAPATIAFGRLMLGTMAKWVVAVGLLAAALALWRLPPLPLLAGCVTSMSAYLLALNFLDERR